MTDPFKKPSDFGGGAFFKPGEHMTALALLVEPKTIERNVPNTYRGNTSHRDEVVADITVFADQAALDKGEPSSIIKSCKVVHGMLTDTLSKVMGGAICATVSKTQTRNGEGYVWRDVDQATEDTLKAYYAKREADVAEAVANAPSFD